MEQGWLAWLITMTSVGSTPTPATNINMKVTSIKLVKNVKYFTLQNSVDDLLDLLFKLNVVDAVYGRGFGHDYTNRVTKMYAHIEAPI